MNYAFVTHLLVIDGSMRQTVMFPSTRRRSITTRVAMPKDFGAQQIFAKSRRIPGYRSLGAWSKWLIISTSKVHAFFTRCSSFVQLMTSASLNYR